MHGCARLAIIVVTATIAAAGANTRSQSRTTPLAYGDAQPIIALLSPWLPAEFATKTSTQLESAWPSWVARHNDEIRARLDRGDEDSIVNLLLFGTSFTKLPRALNDSAKLGGPARGAEIVRGRIGDLVAGVASPGANERLLFVREVVARHGINPGQPSGQEETRLYLLRIMRRVFGEIDTYIRTLESAKAATDATVELAALLTLFRTRGLSSNTSIRPDFAIDQALEAIKSKGILTAASVRRVAVVGPGLDFTDKAEGFDFYPPQTTQPFSVIDSLRRLQLAHGAGVRLSTLDLSQRVNRHLQAARQRSLAGAAYIVVLPHDRTSRWRPDLLSFWKHLGDRIGDESQPPAPPPAGLDVEVRAVRIRSDVVSSLDPHDVNIVLERFDPVPSDALFDLIVATNVFVYYDVFDQALALANVASMLRPGGVLLTNNTLRELPAIPMQAAGHNTVEYTDAPDDNDNVVWYQRR